MCAVLELTILEASAIVALAVYRATIDCASRLTVSDVTPSPTTVVTCLSDAHHAHKDSKKHVSNGAKATKKGQKHVYSNQSVQRNTHVTSFAQGEAKMKTKNWKKSVLSFARETVVNAAVTAMLNLPISGATP